ncbi:MAG: 4-hydroxythreonine-4-phosphate dehydrogenase PdxA [Dehalococcoidia bacterium]
MTASPLLAITLGDPVGIGPEVVAKALSDPRTLAHSRPVVIGSPAVLDKAFALADSSLRAHAVDFVDDPAPDGTVAVFGGDDDGLAALPYGQLSAEAGDAAIRWVMAAGQLAADGRVDAVVTAPINKEAANLAGHKDNIGHQEIYQAMTGSTEVVTMLVTPGLRVVHLTTHKPLRQAADYVTRDNVLSKVRLTDGYFREHGFDKPRIGVAAFNPHGGDGGLIGMEEIDSIAPAVKAARAEGIDATGPVPADTVFGQAIDGRYDVVLAMYHDQGHIPIKVHDWESSVTMNIGLPFLRTSVDHGTAFDIAGKGIADATGMVQAIRFAALVASTGSLKGF